MNFKRAAVFNAYRAMLLGLVFVSCNVMGMQSIASGVNQIGEWSREKIGKISTVFNAAFKHVRCDVPLKTAKKEAMNRVDRNGKTLLHQAVICRDIEELAFLLARGGDVHVRDSLDFSLLHYAVACDDEWIVELLLFYGADVNDLIDGGIPSLSFAFITGNCEIIKLLIAHGADINMKNNYGFTVMHLIASGTDAGLLDLAMQNGVDINVQSNEGFTPLHIAVLEDRAESVAWLIENGADVAVCNNAGKAPIDYATTCEIVELLGGVYAGYDEARVQSNKTLTDSLFPQVIGENMVKQAKNSAAKF